MRPQGKIAERSQNVGRQLVVRTELQVRNVDLRAHFIRHCRLVCVLDNTDDRNRGMRPFVAYLELLAQRILTREVLMNESFVYDRRRPLSEGHPSR